MGVFGLTEQQFVGYVRISKGNTSGAFLRRVFFSSTACLLLVEVSWLILFHSFCPSPYIFVLRGPGALGYNADD